FFKNKYGILPSEARIESLINQADNFALTHDNQKDLTKIPEIFEEGIQVLITRLLDSNESFVHDTEAKFCQFCS
ncbi:MAG: hypothetical protein ACKPKO_44575, partial [Candidatus Fonsibacter sp.]